MIKKSRFYFCVLLMILAACAPGAGTETTGGSDTAGTPELVHLTLGIQSYMSNSPLFIAQADGYFAEQGLEVEFVDFGFSDREILPALMQGQVDVTVSAMNTALLNSIAEGGNVKLVADKGYANPDSCASSGWLAGKPLLEAGSLDELAGLEGRKIVVFGGGVFEYAHDLLLAEAGLTNDDVQVLHVDDMLAITEGLSNGSIDVAQVSEPWISRAEKAGAANLWQPLSLVIPNTPIGVILYGPGVLEMTPDVGVRFMTAYLKAVEQFSGEKTDHNVQIIADYTKLSSDEIRGACWPSYQPEGKIDTAALLGFQQWAVDKGYVDAALDIEQIWDPQFVDQANDILNK